MSKERTLKVCTWNVCLGIKYKLRRVEEILKKNDIDVICIQESEITSHDDLSIIQIEGYVVELEKSCEKIRSLMYIKNNISYERHEQMEKQDGHVILISIKNKLKVIQLASVYRTYKLTTKTTHKEEFADQLAVLKSFLETNLPTVVVGDFNLDYNKKGQLNYNHHEMFNLLDELEGDQNLTQLVRFDTWRRVVRGELKSSLLDHIYENSSGLVNHINEISTSTSDHTPIQLNIMLEIVNKPEKLIIRNWSNYSREKLLEKLREVSWDIDCSEVQDFNDELEQKLMTVLNTLIPFEEKKVRNHTFSEPPWLSDLKRKRKNLFKNARRRKNADLFTRCRKMDEKIKKQERKCDRKRIRNKVLRGGQKGLWDAVKLAQNKHQNQLPREMKLGDAIFGNDQDIAEGFADFFKEKVDTIIQETLIDQNVFNGSKKVDVAAQNFFTEENVRNAFVNLKDKSSYGIDNIPVKILRDGCEYLLKPYHRLLNKIYSQGVVPEQWKTSRILPLHKKGKINQMENYRPISNLCAGSKVFERLVLQRVLEINEQAESDLTGENQHGFKKNRSTITASQALQSKIASLMDQDQFVAMASLDLSAAFDVVNIDLLLTRLKIMGIPEDLIKLLNSWLHDRLCYVEVGSKRSQYYESDAGTVQGSILGPVLFNLFMSPLLEKEDVTSYADDNYLVKSNKSKEIALQRLTFQCKKVTTWMKRSGLRVNISKTELIVFQRNDTAECKIKVNNVEVTSKKEVSVLGIIFDSKLSWSNHVEKAVGKARSSLQALRVIGRFFTTPEKLTLLTSMFYSKLYYAAQIWLLPSLKRVLKTKLLSASGNALRLLDKNLSFRELHKKFNRATPTQFQKYITAVSFYDLVKTEQPEDDWINLQFNLSTDRRNTRLTFHTNNRYKCGLNCLSNRFKSISNEIEKDWIDTTRDGYKTRCKQRLITERLILL